MNITRVVLVSCAAVFALVLALPQTRWIVQNHFDVLAGRYAPSLTSGSNSYLVPDLGGWNKKLKPVDLDSQFVHASAKSAFDLLKLAKEHPDQPALLAHTIRKAFSAKDYAIGSQAAALGYEADPNNAYFALSLAAFAAKDTSLDKAFEHLSTASKCAKLEGYWLDHAEREIRAREAVFGYRGQFIRLLSYAGISFSEYDAFSELAEKVRHQDAIEPRRDLARCGVLVSKESDTLIGMLIGRRMVELSVLEPGDRPFQGQMSERIKRIEGRAKKRDSAVGTAEFSEANRKTLIAYEVYNNLPDDSWIWNRNPLVAGSTTLATLILIILASVLGAWFAARKPTESTDRAMPHVTAFAAWLMAQYALTRAIRTPGAEAESMVGLLMLVHLIIAATYAESKWGRRLAIIAAAVHALISVLMAIPAVPLVFGLGIACATVLISVRLLRLEGDRRHHFGAWAGFAASFAAMVCASGAPVGWIPFVAYVLGLLALQKQLALVIVVLLAGIGFLWVDPMGSRTDLVFSIVSGALLVAMFAYFFRQQLSSRSSARAVLVGVAMIAYVGFLGMEIAQDGRDKAMLKGYLNEAELLREKVKAKDSKTVTSP